MGRSEVRLSGRSDLSKGHDDVKEAIRSLLLSGNTEKVEVCGICLGGRRSSEEEEGQLGEEAVGVVLQALLVPPEVLEWRTSLWLCEECGSSLTTLNDQFLQLEELRTQFNDLRRRIGGKVIVGTLGRSEEEWVGWEEEVKWVEHIFPSCVFRLGGQVKTEEVEEAASESGSVCDFLVEEEEPPEDVKLKKMTPLVLLRRLKESNAMKVPESLSLQSCRPRLPRKRRRVDKIEPEDQQSHEVDEEEDEFVPSEVEAADDECHDDMNAEDSSGAEGEEVKTSKQKPVPINPNSDGRFECPRCGKTFVRVYHMRRHISEVHEGHKSSRSRVKRLGCSFCERLFTHHSALLAHEAEVHSGCPQRPTLPCSHCDMTFRDPLTFGQHKLKTHFLGSTSSGDSQCPFCLKFFASKFSFTQHTKSAHFGGRQPPKGKGKVNLEDKEGHSPLNVACFVCGPSEGSLTPEELKAHEESEAHKEKIRLKASVHCNTCRLNFGGNLETLRLHLENPQHLKEVNSLGNFDLSTFCVPCRKNFGNRWLLETHSESILHKRSCGFRETQSEPKFGDLMKCPSCPKTFDFQVLLDGHIHRQHAPSGYSCKMCGLSFTHRKELLHHRHSHKNETPKDLICEKCGKSFEKPRLLHCHMQIAHEGGPSLCDFCEKPFPAPLALQNHVSSFHSDLRSSACPHCDASFKVPSAPAPAEAPLPQPPRRNPSGVPAFVSRLLPQLPLRIRVSKKKQVF